MQPQIMRQLHNYTAYIIRQPTAVPISQSQTNFMDELSVAAIVLQAYYTDCANPSITQRVSKHMGTRINVKVHIILEI